MHNQLCHCLSIIQFLPSSTINHSISFGWPAFCNLPNQNPPDLHFTLGAVLPHSPQNDSYCCCWADKGQLAKLFCHLVYSFTNFLSLFFISRIDRAQSVPIAQYRARGWWVVYHHPVLVAYLQKLSLNFSVLFLPQKIREDSSNIFGLRFLMLVLTKDMTVLSCTFNARESLNKFSVTPLLMIMHAK